MEHQQSKHLRRNYEKLFYQLCLASNIPFQMSVSKVSDRELMEGIDSRLLELNCILLTDDELNRELIEN